MQTAQAAQDAKDTAAGVAGTAAHKGRQAQEAASDTANAAYDKVLHLPSVSVLLHSSKLLMVIFIWFDVGQLGIKFSFRSHE